MGLFSKKNEDPSAPVEPPKFGFGLGSMNQSLRWGNQQMAQATQMMANMNQGTGMRQRLEASGLAGTATIRAFRATGQQVNLNPVYELDLAVEVPGLSPYEMTRVSEVNVLAVPELVVGAQVGVKVDPADPSQLVIGWMNGTMPA
jgi:hypothetical protein